jgi:PTH1 family peptidyl-tRNA hydrolase
MDEWSLIVGLGNPGERYARTRHNAGFLVVDELAGRLGAAWETAGRFSALVARGEHSGRRLLLAKPQTFMNASGEAVGGLVQFYQLPVSRLLVVVDDADLPLGTLRLRPGGGSGGHHGLESIMDHLGGRREFARQRIGIGRTQPEAREITGHVLGRFAEAEWPVMRKVLERSVGQIQRWSESGIETAMNEYNGVVNGSADEKEKL